VGTVPIRAVIAGSTESIRKGLRAFLAREAGVHIAGECRETEIGLVSRAYDPDLLLLSMQTQDAESSCQRRSAEDDRPIVILVANDDSYAKQAFEMNAVDFLCTPFTQEHVHRAIERARRELLKLQLSYLAEQVMGSAQAPHLRQQREQLAVRSKGSIIFVDVDEIDWIAAAANYVRIHAGQQSYLMRESIGRFSERLDGRRFIRIHRSIIVNVRKIRELHYCNSGEYIAVLRNGKQLSCSRGFRDGLDHFISGCE